MNLAPRPEGLGFERRLLLDAALTLSPAVVVAAWLAWRGGPLSTAEWLLLALAAVFTLGFVLRLRRRVVFPLYTLSNLLEALREGDYSLRGSRARRGDAVGDVVWEVNALAQTLRERRLHEEEASALLAKIIEAIDIAIFSFDDARRLRLINPAGGRLLRVRAAEVIGAEAAALGLDDGLALEAPPCCGAASRPAPAATTCAGSASTRPGARTIC